MVAADFIVGILGNILSIVSYASTIGTFKDIVKKRSSENYDGLPYITSLLSSALWTLYGILDPDDGILIIIVSAIGVASQTIYLAIYVSYASKSNKVKYLWLIVVDTVFTGIVIAVTLAFQGESRRIFVGVLCAAFNVVMYAAPLSAVKMVMNTRSVEYMPFLLSLSFLLSAAVWFVFALLLTDYCVLVPNAVGILLGSLQVAVYLLYRNKSPKSKLMELIDETCTEKVTKELSNGDMPQDLEEGK